jgi:hypothetical protein
LFGPGRIERVAFDLRSTALAVGIVLHQPVDRQRGDEDPQTIVLAGRIGGRLCGRCGGRWGSDARSDSAVIVLGASRRAAIGQKLVDDGVQVGPLHLALTTDGVGSKLLIAQAPPAMAAQLRKAPGVYLENLVKDRGRGPAQRAVIVEIRPIGHLEAVGTEWALATTQTSISSFRASSGFPPLRTGRISHFVRWTS